MNNFFKVTVSQLNRRLSLLVGEDKALQDLYISGEISNFTLHNASGHIYFTLKDEQSAIKCVMFKNNVSLLTFLPKNGMSVIVRGTVKVYTRDGTNQVYATQLVEEGKGQLYLQYLQIKDELEKGGYFRQKRELPDVIRTVCIITSEKAAALQDMLNVIGERCPLVKVILIPASVQGETAPQSLIDGLRQAHKTDADVIIIGRGGGSSEDLSAFNDKQLAIELFNSSIPTISAVGHETDFSITDHVADKRAPTPTAAAVLVTAHTVKDIKKKIDADFTAISTAIQRLTGTYISRIAAYERNINALSPHNKLCFSENELDLRASNLSHLIKNNIERYETALDKKASYISAVNPMNVLVRGYSAVKHEGKTVYSPDDVNIGDELEIILSGGSITAQVTGKDNDRKDII